MDYQHKEIISVEKDYIKEQSKKNRKKLKIIDFFKNSLTYIFSSFTILIILSIFIFIFSKGWSNLSWDLIISDNKVTTIAFQQESNFINDNSITYNYESNENEYFSSRWGISFIDSKDKIGQEIVKVNYVDSLSPLVINLFSDDNNSLSIKKDDVINEMTVYIDNEIIPISLGVKSNEREEGITLAKWFQASLDKAYRIKRGTIITGGNGIRGSLLTTLLMILLTLLFSLPLGIGCAIYLSFYAKENKLTNFIISSIDLLSGIPSIIFGLLGSLVFIPLVSGKGNTGSILSGALTLAIMVLPLIVKNTQEAIKVIPKSLKEGSLALAASESQTIFKIILPNSMCGILTGSILAIGRIIGESASLIYAVGAIIKDKISLFEPSATLSVHIWTIMQGENPNYDIACSISIIIIFIILILNIILSIISKYLNRYQNNKSKNTYTRIINYFKRRKGVEKNG